ncbi:MAG: hypothetical protein ACOY9D_08925 [Pseudomonadota bacterium]
MQLLNLIFSRIGTGLLYGIGFGLVMAIITWGSTIYFEQKAESYMDGEINNGECKNFKKCEEKSGLKVHVSSEKIDNENFILLGQIKNDGDIKWTSANIKAELFDKENKFIDQCVEYVNQKVFPGTSINFKLSCTQCSKIDLKGYNSYKISIVDASTY